VSLLRHRILTLVFVSVFTAPGIGRSAPDAGGSTSSAPTPQVFAPGVFSGWQHDLFYAQCRELVGDCRVTSAQWTMVPPHTNGPLR
jgi:hypothetical protein